MYGNGFTTAASSAPSITPYLDRLKEKQGKLVADIHLKERELTILTALIQFLSDRPEIHDVAERLMET